MHDNKYNNDGTPEQPDLTPTASAESGAYMESRADAPKPDSGSSLAKKRRFHWNLLALILILLGAGIFGAGWISGSRGGDIFWESGGLRVLSAGAAPVSFVDFPLGIAFDELYIRARSANIIVRAAAPREAYGIRFTGFEHAPSTIRITGSQFIIDARDERPGDIPLINMNFTHTRHEIEVYLPPEVFDSIRIASTSGNIRADGIEAGFISLHATSGRIRMYDLKAAILGAETRSGRIDGENLNFNEGGFVSGSGSVNVERSSWYFLQSRTTSGRIRITGGYIRLGGDAVHNRTALQATSGSVSLELRNSRDDFRYLLVSTSGSVRLDGERSREGSFAYPDPGSGQAFQTDPRHLISLTSNSGSVQLDFN